MTDSPKILDIFSSEVCEYMPLLYSLQITNHLDVTVEVYFMNERGNEVVHVVSLKSGEMASLPLHAVYTLTAELFFSVEGLVLLVFICTCWT